MDCWGFSLGTFWVAQDHFWGGDGGAQNSLVVADLSFGAGEVLSGLWAGPEAFRSRSLPESLPPDLVPVLICNCV